MWNQFPALLGSVKIPIVSDLRDASWPNWREGFKEVIVILFFSLMPMWLGLLAVEVLAITDSAGSFLSKFASSSDLGILSASLLGPLLYMMFRDENRTGDSLVPRFPSGLWFIISIIACCIVATVIYCFTYVSDAHVFFSDKGVPIIFASARSVAIVSWVLFGASILLTLFACTIRNSFETQPPKLMSGETQDFVAEFKAAQGGD